MFAQVSGYAGRPNFQAGHAGSIPVIRSTTYLAREIFSPHIRVHTYLFRMACMDLHFYCSNI